MRTNGMILLLACSLLEFGCDLPGTQGVPAATKVPPALPPPSEIAGAQGVAPHVVYFNATGTTSAATTRPYHELEYRWDFGDSYADPAAARWYAGVNAATSSRNTATGPLAAHVYETKGNYTATLKIVENGVETTTKTYAVTVDDPEVVFASTTTCISADGDFTGAPEGAVKVTSSDFDKALNDALHPASGKGARRVLFHRNQTFWLSATTWVDAAGPVTIGAFGAGARPVVKAENDTWGNATCNAVGVGYTGTMVTVMDLEVDGSGVTASPIRAVQANGPDFLMLRVYGHDLGYMATLGGGDAAHTGQSDRQAVVDCQVSNIVKIDGNMAFYFQDAFHIFVAGNDIDGKGGGEYDLRYQGGQYGIISHNTMNGCGDGKSMLTIRGDASRNPSAGYVIGSGLGYVAGSHVVSDNIFNGLNCKSISTLVSIVPQNGERDEEIANIIVERNLFTASPGQMTHLLVNASDVTVRNNLIDATGGGIGPMVCVSWRGMAVALPIPARNQIYHNTFFSNTANGVTAISIMNEGNKPLNTVAKNNFVYAPNTTQGGEGNGGPNAVLDNGTGSDVSNNTPSHSTAAPQAKTASKTLAVVPPTANPSDWKLAAGSYGIGAGAAVPVWSDFNGNALTASSARNLGAFAN